MQKFLYQVAQSVIKNYPDNIGDICIVFPNKRAGIFFRKYLSEIVKRNIWLPHITTISEFISDLAAHVSNLQLADELTLIFELYQVYRTRFDEDFERFYPWGKMLLSDFDEIDKEIIPAEKIFQNLSELKRIETLFDFLSPEQIAFLKSFWSAFDEKSEKKEKFLMFWSALPDIYVKFKDNLSKKHLSYEGMLYRDMVEKIEKAHSQPFTKRAEYNIVIPYEKVIFCGFNFLTKCEEKLFEYLQKHDKAVFYWDTDKYYLENKVQEAGIFIRKNIKKFHQHPDVEITSNIQYPTSNIYIYGVSLEAGQAKLVGQILEENLDFVGENTAIILPDEHLLFPILHSIPEKIQKINVTMGYPLHNTAIYGFIEHIINLHKNKQKNTQGETIFYYRDVISLLKHQFLQNNKESVNKIQFDIEKYNKTYIPLSYLSQETEIGKWQIFTDITDVNFAIDYLLDIILKVYYLFQEKSVSGESADGEGYKTIIEREFIFQTYLAINRLKEIIIKHKIEISIEGLWRLILQVGRSVSVPFIGEPLEDLQIMGVLETRCLDFENVFLLSMNEGIFPKENHNTSFIPYNIRRAFGLSTFPETNNALYAYNFYRLIEGAKNVYLFYNTETTGNYIGEMSRFLYQLKYESPFNIEEYVLANEISIKPPKKISIPKSPEILNKLQNLYLIQNMDKIQNPKSEIRNLKFLSPSAINTYCDCSLKFYFRYIADLKEPEKIKEELDEDDFGKIFHNAVKYLYQNLPAGRVEKNHIARLKEQIDNSVEIGFKEVYNAPKDKPFEFLGRNVIIKEIIKKYITRLLEIDEKYAPFDIISLEERDKYKMGIEIFINGKPEKTYISGTIDRIDKKDNIIRVIDYKTGSPSKRPAKGGRLESPNILFEKDSIKRSKDALQIILYGIIFENSAYQAYTSANNPYKIESCLFYIRKLYKPDDEYVVSYVLSTEDKKIFIEELKKCVEEIFNKDIGFTQTENSEICRYCEYKGICRVNTD